MAQSIPMQRGSPQKYLLEILKSYPHLKTHPRHTYILTSTKIEEESNKLSFKSMFSSSSYSFLVCPSVVDIAKYVNVDRLNWALEKRQAGDPYFIVSTFWFFISRNWIVLWRRGRRPLLHHLPCSTRLLQQWEINTAIDLRIQASIAPYQTHCFQSFFTPWLRPWKFKN